MSSPSLLVGIDLVRVSRVGDSLQRFGGRYARRVFTDDEIAYCNSAHQPVAAERYAARFAAKEATLKVLRPADGGGPGGAIDWRAIEVRRSAAGWCDIVLHGAARTLARRNGIASLALSMSHESDYATAVVVAHLAPKPRRAARTPSRTRGKKP